MPAFSKKKKKKHQIQKEHVTKVCFSDVEALENLKLWK